MSPTTRSEFHIAEIDTNKVGRISGLKRRGLMLALSSPSGAGKTTLAGMLLDQDPDIHLSISSTTRPQRPGEIDGKHYYFTDVEDFKKRAHNHEFLEYAEVFGNHYGTPKEPVDRALGQGQDVLFDIDWQGTRQLRDAAPLDLVSVFILPPSWLELRSRLQKRDQDPDEVIHRRMREANEEISHYLEYDYVIINRDLTDSIYKLRTILGAERMKRHRLLGLKDFVENIREEGIAALAQEKDKD